MSLQIEAEVSHQTNLLNSTEKDIANHIISDVRSRYGEPAKHGAIFTNINGITGSPLEMSDTPGNFTIERETTNLIVRVYDKIGRPIRLDFQLRDDGKATERQ